ncbi:MAG: LD-carboxypeptidase [Paludibacter sp.]|nr:LD-carboxypeptidase [Paludibacter sp.]
MNPPSLQPNDQIRIISPAGTIDPEYIDGAIKVLAGWGYSVTEGKYCRSEYGRFAGTDEQRLSDLQDALDDTSVKAILCSRGGYGIARIIDKIDFTGFVMSPKWLIGFSDITILHNAITNLGISSIHGVMAKYFAELPAESEQLFRLKDILVGNHPTFSFPAEPNNRIGKGHGKLIGGNLSVMMGLRGSRYDLNYSNAILFIEDIGEKPYQIDRMIQNLRFSGVLSQLSGLVVGQFSDCDEDPLMMQSVQELILEAVEEYDYPVCFNFPAGHVDYNLPVILGAEITLNVSNSVAELIF